MGRYIVLELWLAGAFVLIFGLLTSLVFGGGKFYRQPGLYFFALFWPIALLSTRGRAALASVFKHTQGE